jgi:hypothetical protein
VAEVNDEISSRSLNVDGEVAGSEVGAAPYQYLRICGFFHMRLDTVCSRAQAFWDVEADKFCLVLFDSLSDPV